MAGHEVLKFELAAELLVFVELVKVFCVKVVFKFVFVIEGKQIYELGIGLC